MKKAVIIIVSTTILIIGIIAVLYFTGESFQLRNAPLNSKEKEIIKKHFNKEEITYLLENNCLEYISTIANEKDFTNKNLEKYCSYKKNNEKVEEDTIFIVNNNLQDIEYTDALKFIIHSENGKPTHIRRYLDFSKQNESIAINDVITLVNLDYDKLATQSEDTKNFFLEKYFIVDELNRYLNYKQNHTDLSYKDIVSLINSERDHSYYSNVNNADTTKNDKILVNKYYSLNSSYIPTLVTIDDEFSARSSRCTKDTLKALKDMVNKAKESNLTILCQSGYRSYESQNYIYDNYIRSNGQDWTDLHEAKPGFSEYQTGLALDLINGKNEDINKFKDTREFNWLKENAYKYGFILRYPEGKENITGFTYTPYHFRYVGTDAAKIIWSENITLEEYYAYYEK